MADDDKTKADDTQATRKGPARGTAKPKAAAGTGARKTGTSKTAGARQTAPRAAAAKTTGGAAAQGTPGATETPSEKAAGKAGETAAEGPRSAGGRIGAAASDATGAIDRAAEEAARWAKGAGERAGETVGQASERTARAAERASEALSEAAAAVSEAAESFAGVSDAATGRRAAKAETRLTHIAYLLYALSPIMGVTCVAGVMLAYLRRRVSGVDGTLLESHYNWLIWTFWYGLAAYVVSGILVLIYVGWALVVLTSIWMIWRLVKGWLYLYDGKAMSNPTAAL